MRDLKLIEKSLKDSGYSLTEQRRLIIEIFEEDNAHYTAQEIYERARQKNNTINFSTIYRNLELLLKLGIINKLDINSGISHFEMSHAGHHHHIICKCCGEMKQIDMCPYESLRSKELDELGFEATEHRFEIYGYCNKCKK